MSGFCVKCCFAEDIWGMVLFIKTELLSTSKTRLIDTAIYKKGCCLLCYVEIDETV